ncbi:MAG: hypothetical protein K0R65_1442 [Crocinitomicaceae bacterium]|jgi:hypothetical protein|nr:hypothetical protein [Crocinitomicaceae bacterium]
MKKIVLSILAVAGLSLAAQATVRTVSNNTIAAGQYTTVQAAVDASAAGDTVYVHGSATTYGDVTLNKRIVLIGAGHRVEGTQYNLPTTLGNVYLSQGNSTTLPAGSTIKGINITSYFTGQGGALPVNNILLERCYVGGLSFCGNGWIIRNNFLGFAGINNFSNVILSNNVVQSYITTSDKPSVVISNNVFLRSYISSVSYANITNNLFIEVPQPVSSYFTGTQNTYNKNIFIYADPINFQNFPLSGNTGVGNLNTTAGQFVSTVPLNVSLSDSRSYNWQLNGSSIGADYGTDGTDVGIYGGSFPMPNMSGVCTMPQMVSMDIQNSVIPQNGTLDVNIKAKGQK